MIHIDFNSDLITPTERIALQAFLRVLGGETDGAAWRQPPMTGTAVVKLPADPMQPDPAQAQATQAAEPPAQTTGPVALAPAPQTTGPVALTPAPAPARRGRPRKDAAAAPPPAAPAPTAEPPAQTTAPNGPADGELAAIPDAELRQALMTYTKARDINAGLELLKDFGCQRISEMSTKSPDEQHEFVKLANAPVPAGGEHA